jgi:hypothetical protein
VSPRWIEDQRESDALLLARAERSAPHSDQSPRSVVQRRSEVGYGVAQDEASFGPGIIRDLCGDEVGDQYAAAQAPFYPYFGPQGLGLVIRPELCVERLHMFESPLQLEIAALEGLHDA